MKPTSPLGRLAVLLALCLSAGLTAGLTAGTAVGQDADLKPYLRLRSTDVGSSRVDADQGVFRARYHLADHVEAGSDREILRAIGPSFGFAEDDLSHVETVTTERTRHVLFQQVYRGVPVRGRFVRVSQDAAGRPTMVVSGFDAQLFDASLDVTPQIPRSTVEDAASRVANGGRIGTAQLVIADRRLAWQILVWPAGPSAEWELLVDAKSGEQIELRDLSVTKRGASVNKRDVSVAKRERPTTSGAASGPLSSLREPMPITVALADGSGLVFDPDPLATSGASYGGVYQDADDSDSDALNAERRTGALRDIERGSDGLYRLSGPYVLIVGVTASGQSVYTPPAEASASGFTYTRSDDRFEAVNAYHHIDASQRYVQSLGIDDLQTGAPVSVNPSERPQDDSGWLAGARYLFFGRGGVDDAEDAAVVWHEYGHALLEAGAPNLRNALEGQAFHEGWSDYWAMSYQRSLMDAGELARTDWERVFRWDSGDGDIWPGRVLDVTGTYPDAVCSATRTSGCSVHNDGRLWGTAMMAVYTALGRSVTDRLNLLSHRYLAPGMTFRDAAEAVIQADIDHFDADHADVLIQLLAQFGLVDPASYAPTIHHTALSGTEQLGGSVAVEATVTPLTGSVSSVLVWARTDNGPLVSYEMTGLGNDVFRADVPLPSSPATLTYFIQVRDSAGNESLFPADAPQTVLAFGTGPDMVGPVIGHVPLPDAALAAWPPTVSASIDDRLGVSEAVVEYTIVRPFGAPDLSGVFALSDTGESYAGSFNVALSDVSGGSLVTYSIRARDGAASGNESVTDAYTFAITADGLLRVYDGDLPATDLDVQGVWENALPEFGTRVAWTGKRVWGTVPGGPYPAAGRADFLTLPAINTNGLTDAYLVFRHWYDTEHDGGAAPDATAGDVLWDGGNVQASTDGGMTWSVVQPDEGYTGELISSPSNPMSGQQAFGGFSHGWRRSVVELPIAGETLAVRFAFGMDDSNTEPAESYAGWLLDDITIVTERPIDTELPRVLGDLTALRTVPSDSSPALGVPVQDDSGVQSVWVDFDRMGPGGTAAGSQRLPMSATDAQRFEGSLNPGSPLLSGDRVEYRYLLKDVAGNEVLVPAASEPALVLDVRLFDSADLLGSARPGDGWSKDAAGWLFTVDTLAAVNYRLGALVLAPVHVSPNADFASLAVAHSFDLGIDFAGRIEASIDDGRTWQGIDEAFGYDGFLDGQAVFRGPAIGVQSDIDLRAYAGETVQLRLSVIGEAPDKDSFEQTSSFWRVASVELLQRTADLELVEPEAVLHANFPDPFGYVTNISLSLPEAVSIRLSVFDMLGREVMQIADGTLSAGTHALTIDASSLPGGTYFIRLDLPGRSFTETMTVVR